MKLNVNELFVSFQGEGMSAGMPCAFLRLAGCNLHCKWCDTWYAWNFSDDEPSRWGLPTVSKKEECLAWSVEEAAEKILATGQKRLVVTGGEPMMQQGPLAALLEKISNHKNSRSEESVIVEIETNGTMLPMVELVARVKQLNVSPKLASSGNVIKVAYRPDILKAFEATGKANFKFVVASEEDVSEVARIVAECGLTNVILMTEGATKEAQEKLMPLVAKWAGEHGWRWTPRLHILLFDTKRGV